MSGYFNKYKKRMLANGGSIKDERIKDSERFIATSFEDDPSIRISKKVNADLTIEENIPIRVVNIDKSIYEKKIHLLPNTSITVGDYLNFTHKGNSHTYLIDSIEDNSIDVWCNATECKHRLKWMDSGKTIWDFPAIASYTSYGTKIFVSESDYFDGLSTNIDVLVPRNKVTETIPLNMRFMLGNSKFGVYVIGDVAVYQQGMLKLTCRKDRYLEGYDNTTTGICYNEQLPTIPPIEEDPITPTVYTILGEEEIKKSTTQTYSIQPISPLGEFSLLDNNLFIVNKDNSSITLQGNIVGTYDTINYVVDNEIVATFDVMVIR